MTIGGIWDYYSKKVGYGEISASKLAGKCIAVDSPGTMHKMRAVCKKDYLRRINPFSTEVDNDAIDKVWIARSLVQVIEYLHLGFLPIIVFDGKKSPLKIANAGADRLKTSKKAEEDLQRLRDQYKGVDPIVIPSAAIAKARTLLESVDRMPRASVEKYKSILQELGFPWVQSKGEGERTCSLLNAQGLCYAIISADGDCFPFGGQLILREKIDVYDEDGFGSVGFSTAEIGPLLQSVGMEFPLFQELCIMAGTDFNKNIKGIGFNKAIPLLLEYCSISRLGRAMDVSILNHREVRKEFKIVDWKETAEKWQLELLNDTESDIAVLEKYGLQSMRERLVEGKERVLEARA